MNDRIDKEMFRMEIVMLPSELEKLFDPILVWHKKEGELVRKDEKLADILLGENRVSSNMYIESPIDGVLLKIFDLDKNELPDSTTPVAVISKILKPLDTIKVFYSYAREDELLRRDLEKHLINLRRQGFIDNWYDGEITAGTEWELRINQYLDNADIILFLISPDFMKSDYRYSVEMHRAMKRHDAKEARVIPILLRPTDLYGTPFAKLQGLPTNGFFVTHWPNSDSAFLNITLGIRKAIQELLENWITVVEQQLINVREQIHTYSNLVPSIAEQIKQNDIRLNQTDLSINKEMEEIKHLQQQMLAIQQDISKLQSEQEVFLKNRLDLQTKQNVILTLHEAIMGEGHKLRVEKQKLKVQLDKLKK